MNHSFRVAPTMLARTPLLICAALALGLPSVAGAQNCAVPPSGLVAWLAGDGDDSDLSGLGNNGSDVGTVGFAAGLIGQAFSFTGTGYVTLGDDPDLRLTGQQVTVQAWMKPASGAQTAVVAGKTQSGFNDYVILLNNGSILTGVKTAGVENFIFSTVAPAVGSWSHVALVYDGTNEKVFVNGVETDTLAASGNLDGTASEVSIGGRGNEALFNGLIDEVEIFDRALTASEVQATYAAGSAGHCKGAPPAAPCDDFLAAHPGANVIDQSGAANGGAIKGTDGVDVIIGSAFADRISSGRGEDCVDGGGGGDSISGGAGNDTLFGVLGDRVNGGTGTDVCIGPDPSRLRSCEIVNP